MLQTDPKTDATVLSLQRLLIAACYLMQGVPLMEVPQNEWLIMENLPVIGYLGGTVPHFRTPPFIFVLDGCGSIVFHRGVESSSGDLLPTFLTNHQVASSHSVPCNTVDGCEILHHLEWLKPYNKQWDKPPINLSTGAGFRNHPQYFPVDTFSIFWLLCFSRIN